MKRLKLNTLLLFILCMGNLYIANAQSFPNTNLVTRFNKVTVDSSVAVGAKAPDSAAIVDMVSATKGMFVPRMTRVQRNSITSPKNGLIIFNTDENCLNYYNVGTTSSGWFSLCGTANPAQYSLTNCSSPSGPSGTYNQNTLLNSTNTYTLSLNVTQTGNYQIALSPKTNNGYSFSASGVFTTTGIQTVVLTGAGTPVNAEIDTFSIAFNGITVQPGCTLPTITVNASGSFTVNCQAVSTVTGICFVGTALNNAGNYITVPVSNVTAGTTTITTNTANGIYFSSGVVNITASTTSITLYGYGTPLNAESDNFYFTAPGVGNSQCPVSVNAQSSGAGSGTFANPGTSCSAILTTASSSYAADGYYWIKSTVSTGDTNRYRTYCDMRDGGWTLIKSLSEYEILTVEQGTGAYGTECIMTQIGRNYINSKNSTAAFNEYAFALPLSAITALNGGSSNGQYTNLRISIKQQGHTTNPGATAAQVESTTTPPVLDIWEPNNWVNVYINSTVGGGNLTTSDFNSGGSMNTVTGKLFGHTLTKPFSYTGTLQFDNVDFACTATNSSLFVSVHTTQDLCSTCPLIGFNGAVNCVTTNQTDSAAYTSSNGSTVKFAKSLVSTMFGWMPSIGQQLNHHIGTCSNSTDDYGGASTCPAGWGAWRPHRFNPRPDGTTYQGRIVQYWMK